jgi:hypothetical protein
VSFLHSSLLQGKHEFLGILMLMYTIFFHELKAASLVREEA